MSQELNDFKAVVLKHAELAAKEIVNAKFDPLVDKLVAKVKEKIPGTVDDVVLDLLKAQFQATLKAELLGLVDKIDGTEGN